MKVSFYRRIKYLTVKWSGLVRFSILSTQVRYRLWSKIFKTMLDRAGSWKISNDFHRTHVNLVCMLVISISWRMMETKCWRQNWRNLLEVDDGWTVDVTKIPYLLTLSFGYQHPKDIANIKIRSQMPKTCHQR